MEINRQNSMIKTGGKVLGPKNIYSNGKRPSLKNVKIGGEVWC